MPLLHVQHLPEDVKYDVMHRISNTNLQYSNASFTRKSARMKIYPHLRVLIGYALLISCLYSDLLLLTTCT